MIRKLLILPLLFAPTACDQMDDLDDEGAADIQGEEPFDTGPGIEVTARIRPGSTDAVLTTAVPRLGYVFYAAEGASVTLEVTHGGSAQGLDTLLKVYGPRLADGTYPKTIASDEDDGYGKLSRIKGMSVSIPGFYLVELTTGAASTPVTSARARLKLSCVGACDSTLPIQPIDPGLKWYRRSAERRAATLQAYAYATTVLNQKVADGVSGDWAVVMDADETLIDNSAYQQARLDLGVGFSPGSWTAWVEQKAAKALDGAAEFTQEVHALGGRVVIVTNRKSAIECAPTEVNLAAIGIEYDGILCQTAASDKNARFASVTAGTAAPGLPAMDVVMYVGDNIQDFPGMTQEIRKLPANAFAAFGDTHFLIPNPMYGSFEKNLD